MSLQEKSFKAGVIVLRGAGLSEGCVGFPKIHCMKGFVVSPIRVEVLG